MHSVLRKHCFTIVKTTTADDNQEKRMNSRLKKNHLQHESSPYLKQHVHNPVDWYPWSQEAFRKARSEGKPIFLSIGYSTCHWCHVMAHESFEDEEVANLMNNTFVSIKVDREERPDIDGVYMQVAQMMTSRAGWPLTVIMTPNKEPFFVATYIPKRTRYNTIGMLDLCRRIKDLWTNNQENINEVVSRVRQALSSSADTAADSDLGLKALDAAYEELSNRFDEERGGFSRAPKFPSPQNLLLLMRYWKRTKNQRALHMVLKTLQEMRRGGIYDHVGYGFHRYSTDAEWLLPHFEKMLYDQAGLMMAYTEAYQITGELTYRDTLAEIKTYITREMANPDGAFYAAQDADSEGVEGKFYVWSYDEVSNLLSAKESEAFLHSYGICREGNFQDEATGDDTGQNILRLVADIDRLADDLSMESDDLRAALTSGRKKLFEARSERVKPSRDDKVLADWNGYMIAALAKAGAATGDTSFVETAERAMEAILTKLKEENGRLLHTLGVPAFLDDYAYVSWGMLELYEATFNPLYLREASSLMDVMLRHFWDGDSGGFLFTSDESEELLMKRKDAYDGAMPSGNSVALYSMIRLARFLGNPDLEQKAAETLAAFSSQIERMPSAYSMMLIGLEFAQGRSYEVVLAGAPEDEKLAAMIQAITARFIPNRVLLLKATEQQSKETSILAPYTKFHTPVNGKATAHVCIDHNCRLPTNDITQMLEFLDER
jgi:uncharacterized protein YyaL (SSP411 family)